MTLATAFAPRPGELLYSAFARYADAMRYPRARAVLAAAFGRTTGTAVVDLPSGLESLAHHLLPSNLATRDPAAATARALVRDHTLLPYFAPFLSPTVRTRAVQIMCAGGGGALHSLLGIRASVVSSPSHLQYCAACAAEDRRMFGSAHWHRLHQAPGVLVCVRHGVGLRRSAVRRASPTARLDFHSLERALAGEHSPAVAASLLMSAGSHLRSIAEGAAWLLLHSSRHAEDELMASERVGLLPAWLRERDALAAAGFLRPSGHLRLAQLRDSFNDYFGVDLLAALGCSLGATARSDDWLARLARRPRSAHHPLRHLLLLRFLDVPMADVVSGDAMIARRMATAHTSDVAAPRAAVARRASDRSIADPARDYAGWEDRLRELVADANVSLRQIGCQLGVTPKTVQRRARRLGVWRAEWTTWEQSAPGTLRHAASARTRAGHRQRWQQLRRDHPEATITVLRRMTPSTFSYLYRYDSAWLRAHEPARGARGESAARARTPRVDWSLRDASLLAQAKLAVAALLASPGRPIRVRFATVARRMGHAAVLEQHQPQLPQTTAYIRSAIESPATFARRRLDWVTAQYLASGSVPARWVFMRAAGLRPVLAQALGDQITAALQTLHKAVRGAAEAA